MNKIIAQQKGVTIVLFALLLTVLIGFIGLALDGGYIYLQKTRLQNTADAAALACVLNSPTCGVGGSNIFPDVNLYGFDVETTNPVTCPKTTQSGCAKAVASTTWNTFFMGILGNPTVSLSAVGVAGKVIGASSCIVTESFFGANGTNIIKLNNCSASIGGNLNTTNQSGIQILNGTEGTITVFNGNSITGCGNCSPAPVGTSLPLSNLPSNNIPTVPNAPAPSCSPATKTCTYYPGTYTSAVSLDSKYSYHLTNATYGGVYVFNGGLDTNSSTVTNSAGGVSLYIPGNKGLKLTGTVTLSAPTPTGCAMGSAIVLSHPYVSSSYNYLTLGGSKDNLDLTGIVNLTSDKVTVNGNSSLKVTGSFVPYSLTLNGNMYPNYSTNSCNNVYESGSVALVQ